MIWPSLFLLAILAGGFTTHLQARRATVAEARARRAWDDHLDVSADNARLRTMRDSAEADAEVYLRKIGDVAADKARAVIRADNLAAELRFHQQACDEHTIVTERRAWLPTLDGIRADSRDNPPDAVALAEEFRHDFESATVTPLRKGRAK